MIINTNYAEGYSNIRLHAFMQSFIQIIPYTAIPLFPKKQYSICMPYHTSIHSIIQSNFTIIPYTNIPFRLPVHFIKYISSFFMTINFRKTLASFDFKVILHFRFYEGKFHLNLLPAVVLYNPNHQLKNGRHLSRYVILLYTNVT